MPSPSEDRDEGTQVRRHVRELGEAGGSRGARPDEVHRLRDFFARRVLRDEVDDYITAKYRTHVEEDRQWPDGTTADEYLSSLRDVVLDPRSGIYLADARSGLGWSLYFVGRVRRAWRGPAGSNRLVVIFNGERHSFITGFQPDDDDAYVERQGGFWLHRP